MVAQKIIDGVYTIPLRGVNVFILESQDGLLLIDTGSPNSAEDILSAITELDKQAEDINHILVTHWHPDHMGSVAALKRETHAQIYAHPIDAPIIRKGGNFDPSVGKPRAFYPAPGMETIFAKFITPVENVDGAIVNHEINEGDKLSFLPELKIVFTPGHSAGQVVCILESHGSILFAADSCANLQGLDWSIGYEDFEKGKQSLKKLCDYDFQIATFGHGEPILDNADARWRARWNTV